MTTPYTTGTISLTNGSAVITGIGTAWQIALIKGGIVYPEAAGNGLPIATVDSDTQITAAVDWTGTTGTYSYALVRDTAYDAQIAQNAEALARLLAGLEAGTIWKYDMSGDTAGRDIYDGKPKGFSYLDVSVVPAQLWVRASNTEGDWAGPHSYGQGAQGEPGQPGPAANVVFEEPETGLPGTDVEMDVTGTGTTGDPYHVTFTIPRGDPGADGTGTGDVVGPAGATDGHVAVFDGPTGKVLKDGGTPFSGSYNDLSGKPTLGGAAALNVGATAGTVAAGDDARFSAGGSSKNEAIFALEIADLKGARLGMNGGVADAFDDESGVDTVGSVNASYDATNDWYKPTAITGTLTMSVTFNTDVSVTVKRNYRIRANAPALTASGTYIRVKVMGPLTGTAKQITNMFFGRAAASGDQWDMATSPTPVRVTFGGANSVTPPVGGTLWSDWVPFALDNTFAHVIAMDMPLTTGSIRYASTLPTNFGAWIKDGSADEAGTPDVTGYTTAVVNTVPEIEVKSSAAEFQNMALKSVAYSAVSGAPATGRLAVQVVEVDSVTVNTDLIAKISRDGGTTWAPAVLSLAQSLVGPKVYEANNINLSSLPSGTSMKWEIDTANNKNVAVSGVVMQWS